MNFHGTARRLDDIDLPKLGHPLGIGEDEIHAIIDVEARGSGFDSQGRPAMLFEPHVFYRELNGSQRDKAVRAGLAYKKWKRGAYPDDSYPRLIRAMAINEEAALRSASWGMGQIMGFNCKLAGYSTAKSMVISFIEDEEFQLQGMLKYIENAGLIPALRNHDWNAVARGYNGKSYAVHGYHTKLSKAYKKWSKIKDTPFTFNQSPIEPAPTVSVISQIISALVSMISGGTNR